MKNVHICLITLSVSRDEYPNYWQQFVIHFRKELEEDEGKKRKKEDGITNRKRYLQKKIYVTN